MYEIWSYKEGEDDHYCGYVPSKEIAISVVNALNAFEVLNHSTRTFSYTKQYLMNLSSLLNDMYEQRVAVLGYKEGNEIIVIWELRNKDCITEYPEEGIRLNTGGVKFSIHPNEAIGKDNIQWRQFLQKKTIQLLNDLPVIPSYSIVQHYHNGTTRICTTYENKETAKEYLQVISSIEMFSSYNPTNYSIEELKEPIPKYPIDPKELKDKYCKIYLLDVGITEFNGEYDVASYQLVSILNNKTPLTGHQFETPTGTKVVQFAVKLNKLFGLNKKEFEAYLISYAKQLQK